MRFSDLQGRCVAIWGFGREGQAVFQRCRDLGIEPVVAEPDLAEEPPYAALWGNAAVQALLGADVVVKSPGVPITSPLYERLRAKETPITSLTDLWLTDNAQRTIGVTGTKGKSTTSALIDHLLRSFGARSALLGNIGNPVLDEPHPPADFVVLEVSSYQAQSLTVSPRWAVVTSLFPEHLTWHGSEDAYYRDKLHLLDYGPEWVVAADDPRLRSLLAPHLQLATHLAPLTIRSEDGAVIWPGNRRLAPERLPLLGSHNASNIALALNAVCLLLDRDPEAAAAHLAEALATFTPLEHRLETVPSNDGRRWIDDGLATAPEAVIASLEALGAHHVCVIIGGADRGLDFGPLVRFLREHALEVALIGAAGHRLAEELTGAPGTASRWRVADSFAEAARWAYSADNPASTVLLSPGAPSQDEYHSYVERAEAFRRIALGGLR